MLEQLNVVLIEALPAVLAVLLPVAVVAIRSLLKRSTAKLDAETAVVLNRAIMDAVSQGVSYAEQWALKRKKDGDGKADGNEKLRQATGYVIRELQERGVGDLAQSTLERKIESALGTKKEGSK